MCRLLLRKIKGRVVLEASNGLHALEQVLGLDSSEGQGDKVACYDLADASSTYAPVTAPTTHQRPLERVDLVFMDGSMPVMDGYEATAHIRAVGFKGRIIGVTGNALAEDQVRFLHAGAELVLVKPVTGEQIVQQCALVEGNL
jgi:CheY-like chemotaxis protein